MSENTKIEWADHTFNPWEGCQKVGPGCDNCYAEYRNARYAGGQPINWGPGAPRRRTSQMNWNKPIKWNAEAKRLGIRYRVFCASLADVFDNTVDPQWRVDLLMLIRATPNIDWLLLTKRPGNVLPLLREAEDVLKAQDRLDGWDWLHDWTSGSPPQNVWLGATMVNQEEYSRDISKLLTTPSRVHFLSIEPLLGPLDLGMDYVGLIEDEDGAPYPGSIDWLIVGGESGPNARPMSPDWARGLRDQCVAAGVPFLFKQWGEWLPMLGQKEGVPVKHKTTTPDGWVMGWAGKKIAGRLLDGVEHDGFPQVQP